MDRMKHVSYEMAKKLKEIGFNDHCDYRYMYKTTYAHVKLPKDQFARKRIKSMCGSIKMIEKVETPTTNDDLCMMPKCNTSQYTITNIDYVCAPTFEHVVNWFRQEKGLHAVVVPNSNGKWRCIVYDINSHESADLNLTSRENYYNALEVTLDGMIKQYMD